MLGFGKKKDKPKTAPRSTAMRYLPDDPLNNQKALTRLYKTFGVINLSLMISLLLSVTGIVIISLTLFFVTPKEIISFQDGTLAGCVMEHETMMSMKQYLAAEAANPTNSQPQTPPKSN